MCKSHCKGPVHAKQALVTPLEILLSPAAIGTMPSSIHVQEGPLVLHIRQVRKSVLVSVVYCNVGLKPTSQYERRSNGSSHTIRGVSASTPVNTFLRCEFRRMRSSRSMMDTTMKNAGEARQDMIKMRWAR